jgi:hypothetical protein
MIYTVVEYSKKFLFKGKGVSPKTIIKKCIDGTLPSQHHARQLPSESDKKGQWIIEVPDEIPEIKATKTNPAKPDLKTMNRKYFNLR